MWFDKYEIPSWVETATVIIVGFIFGCMFAYGLLEL
jgi:hypothetical protein